MGVVDVAAWLGKEVVAPELMAAAVERLGKRSARKKLIGAVRSRSSTRPGSAFKAWLKDPATRQLLELQSTDAYDRLVDSLALAERMAGDGDDLKRTDELVVLTITCFMHTLDPSTAVAVHEMRSESRDLEAQRVSAERHDEIVALVSRPEDLTARRQRLPPGARGHVATLPVDLQVKVLNAVESAFPKETVAGLFRLPPDWLRAPTGEVDVAVAELAMAYGLWVDAASAFEAVADRGNGDRQLSYVRAAQSFGMVDDDAGMDRCLGKARLIGPCPLAEALDRSRTSFAGILSVLDAATARRSALGALLYVHALVNDDRLDSAIVFLEDRFAEWPDVGAVGLQLARRLLERSVLPTAVNRSRDRARAIEVALAVRDSRREWSGDSGEAVEVACQAYMLAGLAADVVRIGRAMPDGEALPVEASRAEVVFAVVECSIATGDLAAARQVTSLSAGFEQALLSASVLDESGADRHAVDAQLAAAWSLAQDERQKRIFWIGACSIGIDPMPGDEELDSDLEFASLVRATNAVSLGRPREAIPDLRVIRSEEARRALVAAYLMDGDLRSAVDELKDMASRFNQPTYLTRAVIELVGANEWEEAGDLATRTLAVLPGGHPDRGRLCGVVVSAAVARADWPTVETYARMWLAETNSSIRSRWALIFSLVQLAKRDLAWAVHEDGGAPEVENELDAQLWMILNAEFAPGSATVDRALELAERFPHDAEVRRIAVNVRLTTVDQAELGDGTEARWRRQIELRQAEPGQNDSFQSITLPDDPDQMAAVFREILEPQALWVTEWTAKVTHDGFPIGALAAVGGRSYSLVLAARVLGFLPIGTPDDLAFEKEVEVAISALDGVVIVDLSAVSTGWYLQTLWPRFVGAFRRLEVAAESRRDIVEEVSGPRPQSAGTLQWDLVNERPVHVDADPEAEAQLLSHLEWMAAEVRDMADQTLPEGALDEERSSPWGDTITIADAAQVPVWADDAGLRSLCTAASVPSFGTHALLVALERVGSLAAGELVAATDSLRAEYCVDLPVDSHWLRQRAADDEFLGGPALVAFSRRSTWRNPAEGFDVWRAIVRAAGKRNPILVSRWVYAGATGILHLYSDVIAAGQTQEARRLLAGLGSVGIGAGNYLPSVLTPVLDATAHACERVNVEDPALLTLRLLFDRFTADLGPERGAQALAMLGSELGERHRNDLRAVLFDDWGPDTWPSSPDSP
jgi:hypothetical protein